MKKSLAQVREENEGAFTLVELLVVILIIGILAAIAIPAFLNQRKAAVDSSVQSDVKNAATQIETWAVSNSAEDVPGFTATSAANGSTTVAAIDAADEPRVDGALDSIKVSNETVLTVEPIEGVRGAYEITGTNPGGNAPVEFISNAGGLQ